ncbi:hypothetical protein ACTXT7_006944 [Hymenolepis weldensis]
MYTFAQAEFIRIPMRRLEIVEQGEGAGKEIFSNEGVYVNILVTPGVVGGPVNVCFELRVLISPEYPRVSPLVELLDPVGLSDSDLTKLESDIKDVLHSFAGECVIFSLIDFCREFVSSNIPSVDCSICFEDFQREEDVNRSLCNHFFHNTCLLNYHSSLLSTYQSELGVILEKNPHCPKEMRPVLRVILPFRARSAKQNFLRWSTYQTTVFDAMGALSPLLLLSKLY